MGRVPAHRVGKCNGSFILIQRAETLAIVFDGLGCRIENPTLAHALWCGEGEGERMQVLADGNAVPTARRMPSCAKDRRRKTGHQPALDGPVWRTPRCREATCATP
jgi:hypothetical protein